MTEDRMPADHWWARKPPFASPSWIFLTEEQRDELVEFMFSDPVYSKLQDLETDWERIVSPEVDIMVKRTVTSVEALFAECLRKHS